MKPESPKPLKISPAADDPRKTGPAEKIYVCDRCGAHMVERQCKVVCHNCGNRFDCSDLNIYFD